MSRMIKIILCGYITLLDISVEHAGFIVLPGRKTSVSPQHVHVGQAMSSCPAKFWLPQYEGGGGNELWVAHTVSSQKHRAGNYY